MNLTWIWVSLGVFLFLFILFIGNYQVQKRRQFKKKQDHTQIKSILILWYTDQFKLEKTTEKQLLDTYNTYKSKPFESQWKEVQRLIFQTVVQDILEKQLKTGIFKLEKYIHLSSPSYPITISIIQEWINEYKFIIQRFFIFRYLDHPKEKGIVSLYWKYQRNKTGLWEKTIDAYKKNFLEFNNSLVDKYSIIISEISPNYRPILTTIDSTFLNAYHNTIKPFYTFL
jgi:hypothetical protein